MASNQKATDQQISDAYAQTGSIWSTASILGMCGQSVHERLIKLGLQKPINRFSASDINMLEARYQIAADAGQLSDLAAEMGRTKQFICRQAQRLGLTDQSRARPYISETCRVNAKAMIAANGHPRGMLGKNHGDTARQAMSVAHSARWAEMSQEERDAAIANQLKGRIAKGSLMAPRENDTRSWKQGWRTIGGQRCFFRSTWEANYARFLDMVLAEGQIRSWEHEQEVFWFEGARRRNLAYVPDFRVTGLDGNEVYHEVKGWMDQRSLINISKMAEHFPAVALRVVDKDRYHEIRRLFQWIIEGWES